jgi:hypothetical protein
VDTPIPRSDNQPWQRQFAAPPRWLALKLPTSTGELLDRLMPEGVRMVPLWLLGFILLGFEIISKVVLAQLRVEIRPLPSRGWLRRPKDGATLEETEDRRAAGDLDAHG